jgi:hypothetical protein
MPIYEVKADHLSKIEETSFSKTGLRERADLQRLLRNQINVIAQDVLVIAEEFGDWEDSRRRIDLLGIDRDANLVVIELKRTEDGGHMDLQAIRYAAMISTMTFSKAADIFSEYLQNNNREEDATQKILDFLNWSEPDEESFAQDVRIVLASAEFSKEITSSVLWLNEYGLDIRCVRFKPYNDNGRVLIDVEQVIPLPEASEYQVQVSAKAQQKRSARSSTRDTKQYDVTVYGSMFTKQAKRNAIYHVVKALCAKGTTPEQIADLIHWKTSTIFFELDGKLSSLEFKQAAAKSKTRAFDQGRWHCDDDELIYANGKTFAFTKMWGTRTAEAIHILGKEFPEAKIVFNVSQDE